MPIAAHRRVRLNGVLGSVNSPQEIFSYGLSLAGSTPLTDGQVAAVAEACRQYHGGGPTGIASGAILTEVAISVVGAGGKQLGDTVRVPMAQPGGGGGAVHPPQVAYRVSTGSGQRGKSQRGGWYVPCPTERIGATSFVMSPDFCSQAVESAQTFLTAIAGGSGAVPVIASGVAGNVPILQVRVGNAMDTIRRRRNALAEVYAVRPWPVAGG